MNYRLVYTEVNLEPKEFSLDDQLFNHSGQVYFLPATVFKILLKQIAIEENNNYTFIKKYLDVVKLIIESENTINKELPSRKLRSITSGYKNILDLVSHDLIESKSTYSVGHYCIQYEVRNHTKWALLILEETGQCTKDECEVINHLEASHSCNNTNYISTLAGTKINASGAIIAEFERLYNSSNKKHKKDLTDKERNKKLSSRISRIVSFMNNRFIRKGKSVNRVFNSFSLLTSVSRKFVTLNDRCFIELDIKNCQPLFLALFLLENNLPVDESYIQSVVNGCFYETIQDKAKELSIDFETITTINKLSKKMEESTLSFNNRDDTKILTYRSVFFKTKTTKSLTVKIFKELYPLTYDSIIQYVRENKVKMARILQDAEAELILNIAPNCPYFTVHDAIYVLDEQEAMRVKDSILNKIKELSEGRLTAEIQIKTAAPASNLNSKNGVNYIPINSKRKPELIPRKLKHSKIIKFNKFRELFDIKSKQDIMLDLNISERTFTNYKKELVNKPKCAQ